LMIGCDLRSFKTAAPSTTTPKIAIQIMPLAFTSSGDSRRGIVSVKIKILPTISTIALIIAPTTE